MANEALIAQLLHWIGPEPRNYVETLEAWRTSCPRLTVWEDAVTAGLIERVGRTTGNQRRYDAADLAWLEFLLRLRETGMSIADMQRFAQLRAEGNAYLRLRDAVPV